MFPELQHVWKLVKATILTIGILLSGAAALEILRAYVTLSGVHPWLGYGFVALVGVTAVSIGGYFITNVARRPRVLTPPDIRNHAEVTERELLKYLQYLQAYLARLSKNPSLPENERLAAEAAQAALTSDLEKSLTRDDWVALIQRVEEEDILPRLQILDECAERQVRHSVRDIMLAITLSPFRAVDLLVVLYRNAMMVVRVIQIYNSRPLLREQLAIFRDTLRVVATVNFLSFGEKFTEQLFSQVPFLGPVMDNLVQGVGAGLLTSATGHAAKYRCRAFNGWNQEAATQHMAKMMTDFLADTRDLFTKDVLPHLKPRLSALDAWERVSQALGGAFEKTGEIVDTLVTRPVMAGSNAFVDVGKATLRGVGTVGKATIEVPAKGIGQVGRSITRGAKQTAGSILGVFKQKPDDD